jgi:Domain of unknown function (DUF4175)
MRNNILLDKLEVFIRKYYKNQLIKGLIWGIGGVLSAFLITSLLEYFGHFNTSARTILFYLFTTFSLFVIGKYVVIPLLKLYKLGHRLNHRDAAIIIGKHFSEVGDKLLNTLQLEEENQQSNELMQAAIEQKIQQLNPIPFQQAINFRRNLKYIKFVAIPFAFLIFLLIVAPGFTDSSKRLVNYNTYYEEMAPFSFLLDNMNPECIQHSDIEIRMQTKGTVIPSEAYINIEGNEFKMRNEKKGTFVYTLKRLSKNTPFHFVADGFSSDHFEVQVIPKPTLIEFSTFMNYPNYTGRKDELLKNTSDVIIPAGTIITWKFDVRNAASLKFQTDKKIDKAERKDGLFHFVKRILHSERLTISAKNDRVELGDSVLYSIQVIPDDYPTISVDEKPDSLSSRLIYMIGKVSDDYGVSKLQFHYRFTESEDKEKVGKGGNEVLPVSFGQTSQSFYHLFDLNKLGVKAADKVEYYFEVWDNDGVNGNKSTKTRPSIFEAPSISKINEETQKKTDEIKKDIADSKKDLNDLEKDILDLEKKLTEKKQLTWEEKKKIKELLDKHKELEQNVEKIVEENKKNNTREAEFKAIDEQILDKQEQIEKLFDEVMDDEMKELMRQIEELMNQSRKEPLMNKLDQLKMNDKEVQKQLDRMMEQLKQLQLEKKINETVEKLNKLSEEQNDLADETKDGEKESDALKEEQEKLTEKFEEVKKDLKDIDKKNKELETPLDLDTEKNENEKESVDKEQKESEENLGKNKKKKASENQKKAAEGMQKMSKELQQQMEMAMQQQEEEDYNKLREILDNLVQLSKDQEDLMEEFKKIQGYNPKYVELGQHQKKIRDDARMIEDSLLALSKRVKQVEYFINKEIGLVNNHMDKAMIELSERNTGNVINHEQYIMTSMNNLALMLSESLKQMQLQMQSKPGSGSCSKPGQNQKPGGAKSMKEMQEGMKKMLEGMSKNMKNGSKPGSKEFAEAAAMQAAIRKKLRDLQKQLDKEGRGKSLGDLGKTEELMDDLERDLYNKRMNGQVIQNQQEILTRLLEHEKAERKQEQDDKRKSNEGLDMERPLPPNIEEYLKQKQKEQELLKTLPPELSPYYKQKVREYFKEIGN